VSDRILLSRREDRTGSCRRRRMCSVA
jgi:hypothetical protein